MKTLKLFSVAAILAFLFFSCSKSSKNPVPINNNIKITLVSGSSQTGAIGYPVKDSIVVKVTSNGSPASGLAVQFIGSGCNRDLITDLNTKADGTAAYYWAMAANTGQQTLTAVVIANGKRVDSVMVNAMAVTAASLLLPAKSACTPNPGAEAERICQLSTGRLLSCFAGKRSIRYSDDNGTSWNALPGFGANHYVVAIAITPQDEIFAATQGEGVFYSKDAGSTWADISPPAFNKQDIIADIAYARSGKLIFTGLLNDIYISPDKGKTWTNSATGLGTGGSYTSPVELNNGDIYILCGNNVLYKSVDGGLSWTPQNTRPTVFVTAIYVDNNGWFYEASVTQASNQDIIAISKDNGTTFANLVSYTIPTNQPYINNMSVQPDGFFYFGELSYAICRVPYANQVTNYTLMQDGYAVYLVTKSNRFLYVNFGGIYYF